jgi:hypothetical protein
VRVVVVTVDVRRGVILYASALIDVSASLFPAIAEFRSYFEHVKGLRFDDRPDYDYLKRLFRELFFRKGFSYDNLFDWELLQNMNGSTTVGAGPQGATLGTGTGFGMDAGGLPGDDEAEADLPHMQEGEGEGDYEGGPEMASRDMLVTPPVGPGMNGGGVYPGTGFRAAVLVAFSDRID